MLILNFVNFYKIFLLSEQYVANILYKDLVNHSKTNGVTIFQTIVLEGYLLYFGIGTIPELQPGK